jgi:Arc/MetJ-type ribon-helix-helix transcriptional regulator
MSLTVVLANDHAVVRDGLRLWLETRADLLTDRKDISLKLIIEDQDLG